MSDSITKQRNFLGENKPGQVNTHIYIYYSASLSRVQITPKTSTNKRFILERGLAGFPQFRKKKMVHKINILRCRVKWSAKIIDQGKRTIFF